MIEDGAPRTDRVKLVNSKITRSKRSLEAEQGHCVSINLLALYSQLIRKRCSLPHQSFCRPSLSLLANMPLSLRSDQVPRTQS